jgi:predicted nucleic acid-binding protein
VTLVDTNVLLDLLTDDPVWRPWSEQELDAASVTGPLFVNDVVYAELSVRAERMEQIDEFLRDAAIDILPIRRAALFLAGKVFADYRAQGGGRASVLPDFFIGAQAAIEKLPLLTRDPRRYRTYFPSVDLIAPER